MADVYLKTTSSGFRTLTQDIYSSEWRRVPVDNAIQQVFSASKKAQVDELKTFQDEYTRHKQGYLKHLRFDPEEEGLCKLTSFVLLLHQTHFSAALIEHAPLEAVYIFLHTAIYDEIERDVKVGIDTGYFRGIEN